jgi:hypothetical protein
MKDRKQMATRDNTNRGVLFRNNDKADPKHADYKGNANVNGTEFWLDAWINESKDGVKYMKLSFKPKNATTKASARADYDDAIPF